MTLFGVGRTLQPRALVAGVSSSLCRYADPTQGGPGVVLRSGLAGSLRVLRRSTLPARCRVARNAGAAQGAKGDWQAWPRP